MLEHDGRISNADLAAAVGLTPGPCLRRLQRLEAAGVILGTAPRLTRRLSAAPSSWFSTSS
ncbi:Lrp/AsnC family transcriptional regulator [Arthrobacter sp. NPDC080031]|uniref:Lrp/AsnC family transcriptional regulator n=1 Tax=Arthrobacter sp. NPDC080031 TaxID=3155918 RepID=UPI00344EF278